MNGALFWKGVVELKMSTFTHSQVLPLMTLTFSVRHYQRMFKWLQALLKKVIGLKKGLQKSLQNGRKEVRPESDSN